MTENMVTLIFLRRVERSLITRRVVLLLISTACRYRRKINVLPVPVGVMALRNEFGPLNWFFSGKDFT
jgi:hypothetical protein